MPDEKSSLNIVVLTVSDTRTFENDTSGDSLQKNLERAGHDCSQRLIVKDEVSQIQEAITLWIENDDVNVVLITGGTGFSGRDSTPEAVLPLLDKEVLGFGELFRQLSYQQIGSSTIQSRACAGLTNQTMIFCLPGSTGACELAWNEILEDQLDSRHKPCNFVAYLVPQHQG